MCISNYALRVASLHQLRTPIAVTRPTLDETRVYTFARAMILVMSGSKRSKRDFGQLGAMRSSMQLQLLEKTADTPI